MTQNNRFASTFETLAVLATELPATHMDPPQGVPNLSEVVAEFSPLPEQALFLGVANDGLPVLLNLRDPVPGPILVAGDQGSGKTRLLQTIARGVDQIHRPDHVKYAVISETPGQWNLTMGLKNCDGILSPADAGTVNYLSSIAEWAHNNKEKRQIVLLLIDNFETLVSSGEAHQYLRWLLLRGPSRHVWPIVTLNSSRGRNVHSWVDAFHTRLFGCTKDLEQAEILTGKSNYEFQNLIPGSQFAMREGNSWLPFWIPNLD